MVWNRTPGPDIVMLWALGLLAILICTAAGRVMVVREKRPAIFTLGVTAGFYWTLLVGTFHLICSAFLTFVHLL